MDIREYRKELDGIDMELTAIIERRMDISRKIAAQKRLSGAPIYDEVREREIFLSRAKMVKDERNAEYAEAVMACVLGCSRREQRRRLNVYLIGMPGSGKTTLAREAARRTHLSFMDTDEIAQSLSKMTVEEMFLKGEKTFREYETLALKSCALEGGAIVAAGGGAAMDAQNVSLMRGSGRTVFIDRSMDKLRAENIPGRPLIRTQADVERLYRERREKYLEAADFILDPDEDGAMGTLIDYCVE